MKIRQHRPNFVDSDEPIPEATFTTTKELLNILWVKSWAEIKTSKEKFHRFSVSCHKPASKEMISIYPRLANIPPLLMAELNEGKSWWVVGSLLDLDGFDLGLPEWKERK